MSRASRQAFTLEVPERYNFASRVVDAQEPVGGESLRGEAAPGAGPDVFIAAVRHKR